VLLSMPAGLNCISHFFKIYINSVASSTILTRSSLCFRYSGKGLCAYFLSALRATCSTHLVLDTKNCAVRHPRHLVIVSRIFWWQFLVITSTEKSSSTSWPCDNETLTVCRNVCNKLPSNVMP